MLIPGKTEDIARYMWVYCVGILAPQEVRGQGVVRIDKEEYPLLYGVGEIIWKEVHSIYGRQKN